ncbi:uncharacterized protein LOC128728671 [Anopheles nili]|uniref:uncharacterized protein LOC128728671 n=1 Tax=Anopheles nili TaxID=185578 RepID=UPI00237BCF81|nr:uncharacterized protein LOC128728671 [Anopheles nili]
MLSYMLPVEEKSPSATAAAARNLSLNLTSTATATTGSSAGSAGTSVTSGSGAGSVPVAVSSTVATRSIIKPTIKHAANHRYQLIAGTPEPRKLLSGASEAGLQRRWPDEPSGQCDESTNLLGGEPEDDEEDDRPAAERPRAGGVSSAASVTSSPGLVTSDRNFNNLIVVTNGKQSASKATNGNHVATPRLAGVLKPVSSGGGVAGAHYNGYMAVSGDNDDEHHRLLVSANNLRNTAVDGQQQEWCRAGSVDVPSGPGSGSAAGSSIASAGTATARTNGNCRTMNSLNGNLTTGVVAAGDAVALPLETPDLGGGTTADTSLGSDSDSATGAGSGSGSGAVPAGGSKKVKLNKLGGNKNVTLKRVSFGSSKGSMVETLVFETPTPLPEHAEREFFQSPAVLAGAGHTTLYSGGSGLGGGVSGSGTLVHHHYPSAALSGPHHLHHHHHHAPPPHQQYHPQYSGGYHPLDGGTSGLHDDSGIELQEEVERSKVRVSFFQSSKPQSISPPESLHLYGAQSLIQFGGGGNGGYENNNSPLDTYITSAALNQQYDSLSSHQQQHTQFPPDHRDPNMAAVYGGTNVPPSAFNRQMSTESGWDNPFRPGGDLSREADEIVNLIKGGKPITPTGDQSLVNGSTPKDNHSNEDPGATVLDGAVTKHEASQLQASQQNGTKSPHKTAPGGTMAGTGSPLAAKNGTTGGGATDGGVGGNNSSTTPISNQVIPGPQSASHVVIDEKKKKKCTCCVIQ